jgi:hypothetical protein
MQIFPGMATAQVEKIATKPITTTFCVPKKFETISAKINRILRYGEV